MKERESAIPPAGRLDLSHFILTPDQFDAAFSSTYERDLAPYEDDDFLMQRLNEDNRTLRRAPELKEDVQIALISDDDQTILEVVDSLADARQRFTPASQKPINAILSHLTLARSLNDYKVELLGIETSSKRVNAIMTLGSFKLAASIPDELVSDALFSTGYLQKRLDDLYKKTGLNIYPYCNMKLKMLASELQKRDAALRYIDALPGDDPHPVSQETLESDTAYIRELFSEMQATRQYGVKMGYIPDERGGSLVFSPAYDTREYFQEGATKAHSLTTDVWAAADIIHSRAKHPKKLKLTPIEHTYTNEVGSESVAGSLSAEALDPLTLLQLGPDGELYIDRQGTASYAEPARRRGKYHAYRALQATILAHYFDLTHAVTLSQDARPAVPANFSFTSTSNPLESIERLVVPRLRINQASETSPETTSTESDRPKRMVRYHEVPWFVRPLPAGWHASPAAHERAEKLGITLQPGETLVKDHHRGSKALGEVVGHQLVEGGRKSQHKHD